MYEAWIWQQIKLQTRSLSKSLTNLRAYWKIKRKNVWNWNSGAVGKFFGTKFSYVIDQLGNMYTGFLDVKTLFDGLWRNELQFSEFFLGKSFKIKSSVNINFAGTK